MEPGLFTRALASRWEDAQGALCSGLGQVSYGCGTLLRGSGQRKVGEEGKKNLLPRAGNCI